MAGKEFYYRYYDKDGKVESHDPLVQYCLQLGHHPTNISFSVYDRLLTHIENKNLLVRIGFAQTNCNKFSVTRKNDLERVLNHTSTCIYIQSLDLPQNLKDVCIKLTYMILNHFSRGSYF